MSLGSTAGNGCSSDFKRGSLFPLGVCGAVTKLTAFLDGFGGAVGTQTIRGVVYRNDAAGGAPGTLACQTNGITVSANQAAAWQDLAISGSCNLPAGSYYLALHTGPTVSVARYGASPLTGALHMSDDTYSDGPSSPWGAESVADLQLAIYATYTSTSSPDAGTADAGTPDAGSSDAGSPVVLTISNVASSSVTAGGARITWATAPAADSQVEYGSATTYGSSTAVDPTQVTSHGQDLTGLAAGTLYHYRVKSKVTGGTAAVSADFTFTTAPGSSVLHYYVAPTGSDANAGSAQAPWATLNHAATALTLGAGGTIVHVAAGTYSPAAVSGVGISTARSGTAAARIRYRSDTRWGARIAPVNAYFVWRQAGDYVDVEGFEVLGDSASNLGIYYTGSFGRVLGNHVHDIPATQGCSNGNGGAGIDSGNYLATDTDIIGNVVHDVGPIKADGLSVTAYCNGVHGIYHATLRGRIYNNISYRNAGWGIHLWHAANKVIIENNVVFANGSKTDLGNFVGGGIIVGAGDSPGGVTADNTTVANNIVYQNRGSSIREYGATGSGNRFLSNVVFANGSNPIALQTGSSAGTINADPQFVDYQPNGSGDYRLSGSSPALNAGTQACAPWPGAGCAPTLDHLGGARPNGSALEIGAYESGASPAAWPWY